VFDLLLRISLLFYSLCGSAIPVEISYVRGEVFLNVRSGACGDSVSAYLKVVLTHAK
jgi:hypothetical protein